MKDFIKTFVAVLLALACVGFFCFLVIAGLAATKQPAKVKKQSMLVLDLSNPISDKPAASDFEGLAPLLSGKGPQKVIPLRKLLYAIDQAASDEKIKGLYLTGNVNRINGYSGWGTLSEVRRALEAFAASGKPIYAYNMYWDEASYFLSSVATNLSLNPFGVVELNGFSAEVPYFKGALEKLGVQVQVTRVGKYKSAVEPYILDEMSEANREQMSKFLGDLFDVFVEDISKSRNVPVEDLLALANTEGMARGEQAVAKGLVDRAVYYDEILKELKELTETKEDKKTFKQIAVNKYLQAIDVEKNKAKDMIAVIYAEGNIVDGKSNNQVGGVTVSAFLRKARLDDKVKAVVLRVNSPGGSASASEEIQRETLLLKEAGKPVVVSMGSVAASGGYWISAYADEILAEANTITGSIGVFGMFMNVEQLRDKLGVNVETVKTAEMADQSTIMRAKTDAELQVFQNFVDHIYDEFLEKVAEGRNLELEKVAEIAQGRVWSGKEALKLGLVDRLGGVVDAIDSAAERAALDKYKVVQYQRKKEFVETILEDMGMAPENTGMRSPIRAELKKIQKLLLTVDCMNDPNGVYARMPYDVVAK